MIEQCWAFYNGYRPGGMSDKAGDGTGFKAGGYGMSSTPKAPEVIPMHEVKNCIAYYNSNKGFYANHHPGGILWSNNSSYMNPSNYCMLNRKSIEEAVDVAGYGHILTNNLSYSPRSAGKHIIDINESRCQIANNSFLPTAMTLTEADFLSLDAGQLTAERKADGSLPDITFLQPSESSRLYTARIGYSFEGEKDWLMEAAIHVSDNTACIEGPGAEEFTTFYINGQKVNMSNGTVDLSAYNGKLDLKATSTYGGILKLTLNK